MTDNQQQSEPEKQELEHIPVFDDDVTEADNPIPRWWWGLAFAMIGCAVFYFAYYNIFAVGHSLTEELAMDVQQAKLVQEARDREQQAKMEQTMSPAEIGKKYFKTFCVSCHGQEGEGNIGPNLHDNYWIHPPTVASLTGVVTNGVPAKGMPTWGPILGDKKISALVAYVMSLHNVPLSAAGKAPEGTQYGKEELEALMSGKAVTTILPLVTTTPQKKSETTKSKKREIK